MAVQQGLKWLAAAGLVFSLAGCSASPAASEPAKVLAPMGAPALATVGLDAQTASVDYVEGQDVLISELAKSDGEYDVIIAPINLGVKSWNEAQNYQLDGVVTWGNLYMIGSDPDWNTAGNTIAAFGEGAVPSMVFNDVFPELQCEVTYYPSVAEASQALISGQVKTVLLAQPVAAAAMAKTEGTSIQADLQSLWQEKNGSDNKGYPQAAVFVKKGAEKQADAVEKAMDEFLKGADADSIKAKVEEIGADKLGVPSSDLAAKTWDAQNIHFEKAEAAKADIEKFLGVFKMELPDGLVR